MNVCVVVVCSEMKEERDEDGVIFFLSVVE